MKNKKRTSKDLKLYQKTVANISLMYSTITSQSNCSTDKVRCNIAKVEIYHYNF